MQKTSVFSDFYCLPNKLALMGLRPGLSSAVPTGLDFLIVFLTDSKARTYLPFTLRPSPYLVKFVRSFLALLYPSA